MGSTMYLPWEPSFMVALQSIMSPFLTQVASVITMFGEELILILVLGFLYWCYDKQFGIYAGTHIVIGVVLNPLAKNIVMRRRPYMDNASIKCLKPVDSTADIMDLSAQGYSFPSGHSMNSAIVYGSLARYKKRSKALRIIAFALPFLVGLSRVLLGVHYPTDVLVGWVGGILVIFLVPWLQSKFRRRWLFHLCVVLLLLPGFFYCKTDDYYTSFGLMVGFFLAVPFEERFVRFKTLSFDKPISILWCFLRVIGGAAVYLGLNKLLKMPFPESILEAENMTAYLIRTFRYMIVVFVVIGVYPMIFKFVERRHE